MARAINVRTANVINRTESINAFLERARSYKILSMEEEREAIERFKAGDESAADEIINANLLFIFSVASKFADGDEILDLVDEASIGAKKALIRFEPDMETRFNSYAVHYMRADISDYFKRTKRLVGRSAVGTKISGKVSRISEAFYAENGREPSEDEIIEILKDKYGIEAERSDIESLSVMSFEHEVGEDGEIAGEVGELATRTASVNDYEREIEQEQAKRMVDIFLNTLSVRDATVIRYAFGLTENGISLEDEEIGEKLGLTSERVRQIKRDAIIAMRGRKKRVLRIA